MEALPAEDRPFWAEIQATTAEEKKEKLGLVRRELKSLKDLVSEDTSLDIPKDDEFLLRFLRAHDYDHHLAYQLVQNYFRIRTENPQLFKEYLPSKVLPLLPKRLAGLSTRLDPQGRVIFIMRTGLWNPPNETSLDFIRMCIMNLENCSFKPATQISGLVAVMDTTGWTLSKLAHLPLSHLRLLLKLLQVYMPAKIKAIYVINDMAVIHVIYKMAKIFIHPELDRKLHFLGGDVQSLFRHIPPECLPSDFGGYLAPLDTEEMEEDIRRHDEEFTKLQSMSYKKSSRK